VTSLMAPPVQIARTGGLRVLVLHSPYASGAVSGENRVVADEVELLRQAGHTVEQWPLHPPGEGRSSQIQAGFRAVSSGSTRRWLRSRVRSFRPDVIHCHNLFPMLSPSVLRYDGEVPILMTLHNYRLLCLPATLLRGGSPCEACVGRSVWRGVVHRCYRGSLLASGALATSLTVHRSRSSFSRVSRYLAVSEFVRRKYVAAGFPARSIAVKPNFAWPAPRRRGPGDYFLAVGRLSEEKGFGTAVEAWRRGVPARLVILGDGPLRHDLEARAPANVEFRGVIPPEEVAGVVARARAVVVPSVCYEGSPRAVTEAFAAGVPVIGSRLGAIPEVVHDHRTGILVPAGNPAEVADAARTLCDDQLSNRLGAAAYREWETRYSPARAIHNLERAYAELVPAPSAAGRP
jgi:glycosyltransferase involved in cell wall biosynthesis